jgi:type I restriction enzyme S subunit
MELRKGYKQTEVGIIPDDWEVKELNNLSDKIMVGIASAATHAYRETGVVMFRNQNIKPNHLDDSDILYITREYESIFKNKRLRAGDLLTARTGYPGTTCRVPQQYEGAQSFTTLITRLKDQAVNTDYLCNYINSEKGQSFFDQNQIGGGQKNVNAGTLKLMPIPIPTLAEQTAIATALSDADALISSLEKLIEKKRAVKQGAMQELLKPKEGWVVKKLGEVAEFYSGGTPSTSIQSFYGGNIQWITSSDLNKTTIDSVEGRITKSGLENSSSKMISRGTLLIALYGATSGVTAISNIDAAINQAVLAIIPKEDDTIFLFYSLTSLKNWILSTFIQGGQGNLSGNIYKELEVHFPKLVDQRKIATILSDMDTEISSFEQNLSKYKMLKQGMMQELLTGKTRLI